MPETRDVIALEYDEETHRRAKEFLDNFTLSDSHRHLPSQLAILQRLVAVVYFQDDLFSVTNLHNWEIDKNYAILFQLENQLGFKHEEFRKITPLFVRAFFERYFNSEDLRIDLGSYSKTPEYVALEQALITACNGNTYCVRLMLKSICYTLTKCKKSESELMELMNETGCDKLKEMGFQLFFASAFTSLADEILQLKLVTFTKMPNLSANSAFGPQPVQNTNARSERDSIEEMLKNEITDLSDQLAEKRRLLSDYQKLPDKIKFICVGNKKKLTQIVSTYQSLHSCNLSERKICDAINNLL